MAFYTVVGDVLGNDFLHPLLDGCHIFQLYGAADAQVAEVTFGYRMLYEQFSFRKQLADSFVKNEAEGTDIGAHT